MTDVPPSDTTNWVGSQPTLVERFAAEATSRRTDVLLEIAKATTRLKSLHAEIKALRAELPGLDRAIAAATPRTRTVKAKPAAAPKATTAKK
jgi:uncharacterized protein involved in exopolysaccharide biosynthesis